MNGKREGRPSRLQDGGRAAIGSGGEQVPQSSSASGTSITSAARNIVRRIGVGDGRLGLDFLEVVVAKALVGRSKKRRGAFVLGLKTFCTGSGNVELPFEFINNLFAFALFSS
jgi:hypothetical protein